MPRDVDTLPDLVSVLRWRGREQPERAAFAFLGDDESEHERLGYGALLRRASAIAVTLQARLPMGSRVLLLFPPGLAFVEAFFACLCAGMVAVPAYPARRNQKSHRLAAIVADAEAALALAPDSLVEGLEAHFKGQLQAQPLPIVGIESLAAMPDANPQWPAADPERLAVLQYTSGSTGNPKGVMVSHGNMLHNAAALRQVFALDSDSVTVSWAPSFHDLGLIGSIVQPVCTGFLGVLMAPITFVRKPVRWLRAISRYRADHAGGPNFCFDLCIDKIDAADVETLDLSCWRAAYNGAEPVRATTLRRFAEKFGPAGFRAEFMHPCFGMAEATLFMTGAKERDAAPVPLPVDAAALHERRIVLAKANGRPVKELVGCGRPRLGIEVVITDPETRGDVAPGGIGEIWIAGPSVAQGYWRQPEATRETFRAFRADTGAGPYLRTGDLGFLRDGELFVTGRIKDLIMIRGQNLYPQDIEETVEACHPDLQPGGACAFAFDEDGIEKLVVAQEVRRARALRLDKQAVFAAIRRAIWEDHELQPHGILLLVPTSLPRTSSGKVRRRACRARFLDGTLRLVDSWHAPLGADRLAGAVPSEAEIASLVPLAERRNAGEIATWLIDWTARKLRVSSTSIDPVKPFADYGLDSMAAVELAERLERWLGSSCPIDSTIVWTCPTIESLSAHLATEPLSARADEKARVPQPAALVPATDLTDLSDAELARLLAREIGKGSA
jgi:acyl-CoA synthetase (AMP-forming)/AMP-acid ligase II/acyl carrier protein